MDMKEPHWAVDDAFDTKAECLERARARVPVDASAFLEMGLRVQPMRDMAVAGLVTPDWEAKHGKAESAMVKREWKCLPESVKPSREMKRAGMGGREDTVIESGRGAMPKAGADRNGRMV